MLLRTLPNKGGFLWTGKNGAAHKPPQNWLFANMRFPLSLRAAPRIEKHTGQTEA